MFLLRAVRVEDVLLVVQIGRHVGVKVHRVRACDERAVVVVGIEHLHRQRLPAARRAAIHKPRPSLPDAAKLLLNRRNQLRLNRVAIRPQVRRVHRIAVVVVRIRVVDLHDQQSRLVRLNPVLVVLVALLLHDAVVALQVKPLGVIRLQIRIRRRLAEVEKLWLEVVLKHNQRIVRVRMLVEPLRHHHHRAQVNRRSPEIAQQLRLNPQVPDVLRIRIRLDRRNHLRQLQMQILLRSRCNMHLHWLRVQVPRLDVPVLSLAHVRRQLHRLPVAAMKRLIDVQHGLHGVVTRRHLRERPMRIPINL